MEGHAGYNEKGEYKGLYIGKDGKPVDLQSPKDVLDKGSHIDNNTMRDTAQVKPSTRYFDNPEEMMAEALTDYRMNPASRARLQTESPQLYQAAKHLDQLELDKMYGQGKKVRLPDGTVGDASAADAIE